MKKILLALSMLLCFNIYAAEPQKVCIDKIGKDGKVVTGKDGKPVQECKMMKKHKKLEGTEVPKK